VASFDLAIDGLTAGGTAPPEAKVADSGHKEMPRIGGRFDAELVVTNAFQTITVRVLARLLDFNGEALLFYR
jgi:hypothetical protein